MDSLPLNLVQKPLNRSHALTRGQPCVKRMTKSFSTILNNYKVKYIKMSSKSKTKGSNWEREIAKHLSELYSESFIRVPGSGAYVGGKNSVRKEVLHEGQIRAMKGDIIPPLDWHHFNCEAKNYAELPFHQLVQEECKQLESWLNQIYDAADEGDLNILIIKITRKGKYVAVQEGNHWQKQAHFLYHSEKYGYWQIYDYDLFWKNNHQAVKNQSLKK